jgi:hypothetical protein
MLTQINQDYLLEMTGILRDFNITTETVNPELN